MELFVPSVLNLILQDHGKTSLTDALIATNGIISPKLAGKIRYLDSRPDEQLRGITMESSAISLYFSMLQRSNPSGPSNTETQAQKEYLINLIDSPGHIDFSSEVSTASRLCDGALVLVDAVEGVCSQTVTVLRQTWIEHLKPLLVINKIDRLVTELKMTPGEAYTHLSKLLEQVNAVIGSFFQGERMEEDLLWRERVEERVAKAAAEKQAREEKRAGKSIVGGTSNEGNVSNLNADRDGEFEEKDDEDLYFAPEKHNVIFSSAVDGWAFTIRQFASLYEKKLGIKRSTLEKVLWGDFYLDPKTRRVLGQKHLKGRVLKPMFVQLVLEQIWAVYAATTGGDKGKGDPAMVEKITQSLSLKLPLHVMRSRDPRAICLALFSAWLPLSTAVLVSVVEHLPAPPEAQAERLPDLIDASPGATFVDPLVRDSMIDMKSFDDDPVVAFISKMVAIPQSELPENKRKGGSTMTGEEARDLARKKRAEFERAHTMQAEGSALVNGLAASFDEAHIGDANGTEEDRLADLEHLIGFARVFSGTLSVGSAVYALPPKFSPANPHASPEPQKVTVTGLYLLMGRSLESLSSVGPGIVCGVAGLEGHVLKSGTLCSQLDGAVNLAGVNMGGEPIVRVALEPVNPGDLDKMIRGMKLLEQSDPSARYEVLESGEHVILTAGELHLERCLKDLRERFARCEIQAGEPIVPYRETIVDSSDMLPPKNKDLPRGTVIGTTTSRQITVQLRVRPLPKAVTEFLDKNAGVIRKLYSEKKAQEESKRGLTTSSEMVEAEHEADDGPMRDTGMLSLLDFREKLREIFTEVKGRESFWADVVDSITAFGPRRTGPNLLIDSTLEGTCQRFLQEDTSENESFTATNPASTTTPTALHPREFSDKISYAFQLATAQGPMCHEPIHGVAVFLESISVPPNTTPTATLGHLTGEVIKTVQSSIHVGFNDWSPRLMLAMYACEITASPDVLGRVYSVLSRRHGTIITEALKEGTPFYSILSHLPVAESFGFAEEIRKRTSGAAQPQLVFSGFEVLDEDPFWEPRTVEELEDFGEFGDRERLSRKYVDGVRGRKGMLVKGRGVIRDAEKQKTLKR